MKPRLFLFFVAIAIAACQRPPEPAEGEGQRHRAAELQELDDKIARLEELENRAAERTLAETEKRASENQEKAASAERERARLEKERAALMQDRDRLAREQAAADERARAAENAAEAASREAEAQTVDFFYTALEPYGDWLEVDRYGYVWQPREASDSRWRPYTDGRWVLTDYGWFWKSNEPFGWAAYHYGRWARIRRIGWVWVPGTEWGPAWVSWRRGDRYVGWAPLPPEAWSGSGFTAAVDSYYDIGPGSYNFVPVAELAEPTYVGRVVQAEQNVSIVNNTVNVTNVTYKTVNKNVVVYNAGPDLSAFAPKTAEKIPRVKVERDTRSRGGRDGMRSEQRGETLVVAAPRFEEPARKGEKPKPGRVKQQVKAPELERGWGGGDTRATEQARARVKKEAAEAEERQRDAKKAPAAQEPPVKPAKRQEIPAQTTKATPSTPSPAKPSTPASGEAVPRGREDRLPGRRSPENRKPGQPDLSEPSPAQKPPVAATPVPEKPSNANERPGRNRGTERVKERAVTTPTTPAEAPTTPRPRSGTEALPPATPAAPSAPEPPSEASAQPAPVPERPDNANERPGRNRGNGRVKERSATTPATPTQAPATPTPQTEALPPSTPAAPSTPEASSGEAVPPAGEAAVHRRPRVERQRPDRPGAGNREAGEKPGKRAEDAKRSRGPKAAEEEPSR